MRFGRSWWKLGGSELFINGVQQKLDAQNEYKGLYDRFLDLVKNGASDVDSIPFVHVSDAFLAGERIEVRPFDWA